MIKEFNYVSHNETKQRKVFVIKENANYIGGLDLNLLSKDDAEFISDKYKDIVPTSDFSSKIVLDDYNPIWNKAYRQFKKSNIVS